MSFWNIGVKELAKSRRCWAKVYTSSRLGAELGSCQNHGPFGEPYTILLLLRSPIAWESKIDPNLATESETMFIGNTARMQTHIFYLSQTTRMRYELATSCTKTGTHLNQTGRAKPALHDAAIT